MDRKQLRAAIYARQSRRISADERERDEISVSIPQQIADARQYANEKGLNIEDKHIFIDAGLSGSLLPTCWAGEKAGSRPALSDLIASINRGEIDVVIVRKSDRLARNLTLASRLYEFFTDHKVGLLCTSENLPTSSDASGRLTLNVLSSISQYVRENIAENVRDTKRQAKREGRKLCSASQTPGYQDGNDVGKVDVDESIASAVRVIFEMFAGGNVISSITEWANKNYPNAREHQRRDGKGGWYDSTIQRIVRNPHYIGMTPDHRDELIPSKAYPALVDKEVWLKCQQRIVAQKGSKPRKNREPHLLSGLLFCGVCGNALTTQQRHNRDGSKTHLYYCRVGKHGYGSLDNAANVQERFWIEFVESFWATYRKNTSDNEQATNYKLKIARIDENLDRIKRTLTHGDQDDDGLADEFADLVRQSAKEKSKLQEMLISIPNCCVDITPWVEMTFFEKRATLRFMINRIDVFRDHCIVTFQTHTNRLPAKYPLMKRRNQKFNNADPNCWTPKRLTLDEERLVTNWSREIKNALAVNWANWLSEDFYHVNFTHQQDAPSLPQKPLIVNMTERLNQRAGKVVLWET